MVLDVFTEKKDLELKKHVAIIHCHHKFSLLESKSVNALLKNAYNELLTQETHKIYLPKLCRDIGYDSKDYKKIKQVLKGLASKVIEWNLLDKENEGKETWHTSAMIASASIDGAYCEYSYSPAMRQLLYMPKVYGRLNMKILSKFKSSYGIALYENCMRYQGIPQTPRFELTIFRKLMGVPDGKYPIFRDLKRRVIDIAIKEINQYSDMQVAYKLESVARQVRTIQFYIKKKEFLALETAEKQTDFNSLYSLLLKWNFSEKNAKEIFDKYGEEYIREKIFLIKGSTSYRNGKIGNLALYLQKALEENYKPPKSSMDQLQSEEKEKEQREELRRVVIKKYKQYLDSMIDKWYELLGETEKEKIQKSFEENIKPTIHFDIYLKEGITNPLVKDKFYEYIRAVKLGEIKNLKSYEDFYKNELNMRSLIFHEVH